MCLGKKFHFCFSCSWDILPEAPWLVDMPLSKFLSGFFTMCFSTMVSSLVVPRSVHFGLNDTGCCNLTVMFLEHQVHLWSPQKFFWAVFFFFKTNNITCLYLICHQCSSCSHVQGGWLQSHGSWIIFATVVKRLENCLLAFTLNMHVHLLRSMLTVEHTTSPSSTVTTCSPTYRGPLTDCKIVDTCDANEWTHLGWTCSFGHIIFSLI